MSVSRRCRVMAVAAGTLALIGAVRGQEPAALRTVAPRGLHIGAAVNPSHTGGRNALEQRLVVRRFNTITNENALKWERVPAFHAVVRVRQGGGGAAE